MVPDPNNICPLNIEAIFKFYKLKGVLIDNGSTLNLYTFKFVVQVGYTIMNMHSQCITTKVYDDVERSLVG